MSGLWQGKCPRCYKGKVFKKPALSLLHFTEMHDACPICHATFQPEPGFYFGAMFISYAFTVAIMFLNWVLLYFIFRPATSIYIYSFLTSVLIATPFSYRYSRLVWLYWFGGHKHKV